jgi:peptide/nickel transport system substrate-binding protein
MKHKRIFANIISVLFVLILLSLSVISAKASTPEEVHFYELTFNPSGPIFNNGKFNPFAIKEIREAMNILIDRDYIKDNISAMVPLWLPISSFEEDYEALKSDFIAIETQYEHNLTDAEATIKQYMESNGAEKVGDQWQFNDEDITIIFLIRIEDERLEIGDYVAGLLENIGFTVDRQYKTSSEAFPIWYESDPADGEWHIYTGGWIHTDLDMNEPTVFQFYYTPESTMTDTYGFISPLYAAYAPSSEFRDLANIIAEDNFLSNEDRLAAVSDALYLAMQDSVRIWIGESPVYRIYQPFMISQ